MSVHSGSLPAGVANEAKHVEVLLGIKPIFESLGNAVWRVTFQNDRAKVTADWRDHRRGGIEQLDTSLIVDGKVRRRPARDFEQLAALFTDTTATLQALKVDVVVPPPGDIKQAPAIARHMHGQLAVLLKRLSTVTLQVSQPDKSTWVVGVYSDDGMLELRYQKGKRGWGFVAPRLVLDSEDCSDEVRDVEEAIQLFLGARNPTPADNHRAVKPQGAQTTPTSVLVRNTAVMRN